MLSVDFSRSICGPIYFPTRFSFSYYLQKRKEKEILSSVSSMVDDYIGSMFLENGRERERDREHALLGVPCVKIG